MTGAKITDALAESLAVGHSDDRLELIVELTAPVDAPSTGANRAAMIAARKAAFSLAAAPIAEQIREMGGEITGEAWINNSMRARLAKRHAPALSANESVKRLDLPRQLEAG